MSQLSQLVQHMNREQLDAYCEAVDGLVDSWDEKIATAKAIIGIDDRRATLDTPTEGQDG